jgi:hypothetical protein
MAAASSLHRRGSFGGGSKKNEPVGNFWQYVIWWEGKIDKKKQKRIFGGLKAYL